MKLYVISGSHPCATAEAALRAKGLHYRAVELPHELHRPYLRMRFGRSRAPAMLLDDGEKVSGSREILRRLDALAPEPPLFPSPAVEEAERWGDEVFQNLVRRILLVAIQRRPESVPSYTEGSRFRSPPAIERRLGALVQRVAVRVHGATEEAVREDLAALPGHLDRIDGLIGEGVLGGEQPNAADLQIASSVRSLSTLGDMEPLLRGRPALALAERLFPDAVGHCPAGALPASWMPSSAEAAAVHSRTD